MQRCTICFFLFLLCQCSQREERNVQRSFYYWKTVFRLSPAERQTLQQLSVKQLYVKFFDVEWNRETAAPQPAAKSIFRQPPPPGTTITPVVFITQEPLAQPKGQLPALAANIASLLSTMAAGNHLPLSTEVQIDCDWTTATRDNYFYLLKMLKQQPFFKGKTLSVTLRLHQVKFLPQAGTPPADKGLLMCYNMGNLRQPQTANSIIDEAELKKYIGHLQDYPLPLDVALPIFDWFLLFEGDEYKGLVRDFTILRKAEKNNRIVFQSDTVINGYSFKKGQWVRHERSDAATVKKSAALLSRRLKQNKLTVILYHLDQQILANYTLHELESIYNSLR